MIAQLAYTLTPEELIEPLPKSPEVNPHEIAYWEARQLFYLRLMNRFMNTSYPHRTHEIQRLHGIREQALQQIDRIKGAS